MLGYADWAHYLPAAPYRQDFRAALGRATDDMFSRRRVRVYNSRANSSDALVLKMDQAEAARRSELEALQRELEDRFARAMRAHGFDPKQAETTALPGALAELYAALAETRAELAELTEQDKAGET